ncbi:phosphate acyltransferase PlsX [Thermanaerosceptrum fracticalcis]|uniref:Phosphate acyltransferase n=1 Tax=Thermanaerosceptrum fracticalcis TaxID=1712410 RepID=A0A7G6E1J7_THEFR|nr:phosphate acyltransferase PlsX [Thermanaerosceptrum fracticalcis]QNB45951.1 phosphate acyltransferase PlsX [Thermanaerosceptrum fracticalcis]
MRIALDAMGGDYAPEEIVKGALAALNLNKDLHIVLVGKEDIIKKCLAEHGKEGRISICHCEEVIAMDEHPAIAYRKKKDASISVATRLVKEQKADAVVSAGSTGAQMVAALFGLGRIPGIDRPAIGTVIPTLAGPKLLLDAGANADCKPDHLVQFALMGSIYAEKILEYTRPRVGLVNIGEEPSKGNELTLQAYDLLSKVTELNFIGNIEGRDIPAGKADVMVCDGFVGNTILKVIEGTAGAIFSLLKQEFSKNLTSKMGAALLAPGLRALKSRLDYAEYGGAPLLGVKGISIICHGSSKAPAIKNAIRVAMECVQNNIVETLKTCVKTEKVGE